jgi:N-acetylglucosamine-6-phosphate deacetylase
VNELQSASCVIKSAQIVLPEIVIPNGFIEVTNGKITGVSPGEPSLTNAVKIFDVKGATLTPGFIDLHVHGGNGGSFNSTDPTEYMLAREFHLKHGTTSLLASTFTSEFSYSLEVLRALAQSTNSDKSSCKVLGIHTEGPFISANKPGAHTVSLLKIGDLSAVDQVISAADNFISMVTVAPEIPGGMELIKYLTENNIVISIGHTNATYAQAKAGIMAGARSATHLFNAMSPLSHRDPGAVGAILDSESIFAEMILDGVHIDEAIFRIVLACKGEDRINLITDATSLAGMPDGDYEVLSDRKVRKEGGKILISGTETLAGSALDMNQAYKNAARFAQIGLSGLSKISSLNAAKIIGRESDIGSLEIGKWADLVLLDSESTVCATMIEGQWKFMSTEWESNLGI